MQKYFCENLRKKNEGLKLSYICTQTKKVCPMVRYTDSGEATPNIYFVSQGCPLLVKKEEKKETKEEIKKPIEKKVEEIAKETKTIPTEQKKENHPKTTTTTTPKKTNKKKKTNNTQK